jgi:hypothetical protein
MRTGEGPQSMTLEADFGPATLERGRVNRIRSGGETCVKCGVILPPKGVGRPPRYCSTACRRTAEYELRRLQRHLERLEDEERQLDRQIDPQTRQPGLADPRWAARERLIVVGEIRRYEERLRELLDDADSERSQA